MAKSDSQEVFVAYVHETNCPDSGEVVYAGHDHDYALEVIKNQIPGDHDRATIELWKDGECKFTQTYSLSLRLEVTPV